MKSSTRIRRDQRLMANHSHSGVPLLMSYIHDWLAGVQVCNSSDLKKSDNSRAADSGESEPWIKLNELETPKSPRIVPGAAFDPKVAPIRLRAMRIASLPSSAMTMTGELVMNFTSPG